MSGAEVSARPSARVSLDTAAHLTRLFRPARRAVSSRPLVFPRMAIHATWNDHALLLWGGMGEGASPRLADGAAPRDLVGHLSPDGLLSNTAGSITARMWLPVDDAGPITECVAAPAVAIS